MATITFDTEYISTLRQAQKLTVWRHHGERSLGVFGYKHNGKYIDYELIHLNETDPEYLKERGVTLKEGEIVARIDSDRCRIGNLNPLVKLNLNRGLVYFLDDANDVYYFDEVPEEELPLFKTRGLKCRYIKIIETRKWNLIL